MGNIAYFVTGIRDCGTCARYVVDVDRCALDAGLIGASADPTLPAFGHEAAGGQELDTECPFWAKAVAEAARQALAS